MVDRPVAFASRGAARGAAWALFAFAVAGCATLGAAQRQDPETILARGLASLAHDDYTAAYEDLAWVYAHYADREVGGRALMAMAAAELDPRNPGRRLDIGAEVAGRYIDQPNLRAWERPVMETLYLLAVELGGKEYEVQRAQEETADAKRRAAEAEARADSASVAAGAAEARARRVPRLPGPAVPARLASVREERDAARGEAQQLRQRVSSLEAQLAEARQELERIRKTLKP